MNMDYVVVSDLDGTLLDHHNYTWDAAAEALGLLKARHIPLVLCSSKTAAEMAPLREALDLQDPFIVENGAAVYVPDSHGDLECVSFGMNRTEVLAILARLRDEEGFRYTGFSDMSVADVVAATGLDEESAANALQREFTEPLLWQDSEECVERFLYKLGKSGLAAVQGGRFLTVAAGCDKGRAVAWLRQWYAKANNGKLKVIALGDSGNDVTMLESADLPVLVKSPVNAFPSVQHDNVYRTQATGPAGWNEAILKLIK